MTTYDSKQAIADVSVAPYSALKARFKELAAVVDAVGNERQALDVEIRRRERDAAVQVRVEALTKDGKQALRGALDSAEFSK